jgi:hypothetical protein
MQTKSSMEASRSPAPMPESVVVQADVMTASAAANSRRALNRFASLLGAARRDPGTPTGPGPAAWAKEHD